MTRLVLSIGFMLCSLADASAQELEQQVDSLYRISLNSEDPVAINKLIIKSRQWLEEARKDQKNSDIAKAYLSLSKGHFLLGEQNEALKFFKLYMIESNQQSMDSVNSLSSRKIQTYEHEVKALLKIQEELEKENTSLKEEKQVLFTKNTYIHYSLLLIACLIIAIPVVYFFKKNKKSKVDIPEAEKTEPSGESNSDLLTVSDEISVLIDDTEEVEIATIPRINDYFLLLLPQGKVGGDGIWQFSDTDCSIFAIYDAPLGGTPGFLFGKLVQRLLNEMVVTDNIKAPSLLLTHLEQKLKRSQLPELDHGLAIGICSFDNNNRYVDYAAAKLSLFCYQENEVRHFSGDTYPLLSSARQKGYFSTERIDLSKSTNLIFASDGFAMQLGGKETKTFGQKSMKQAIEEVIRQPMAEQKAILHKLHNSWKGSNPQNEDILIVGMKF